MKNILLVGCGDLAIRLADCLPTESFRLWGLHRSDKRLPTTICSLRADVTDPESLAVLHKQHFDVVIFTLTPGEFNETRYRQVYVEGTANVLAALKDDRLTRIIFVSSTSVYNQQDGGWVDESSPVEPTSFSGQTLLAAEKLCQDYPVPATVIRFAGIYSSESTRLIDEVIAGKAASSHYSNRIHRADCAGFIAHVLQMPEALISDCYIGVDNEPTPMVTLKNWLADQLDCPRPSLTDKASARGGNKRCSNRRLLATGYHLKYGSYREGYGPALEAAIEQQKEHN